MGSLHNPVTGESVLHKGGSLPELAPAHTTLPARLRNHLLRWQTLIKLCWSVEGTTGIDAIPLQGHVIGAQVTQLEHIAINGMALLAQLRTQIQSNPMGNRRIIDHKNVADAELLDLRSEEGTKISHRPAVGEALVGREAKLVEREADLVNLNPLGLQMSGHPRKEGADVAHEQQHRPVNVNRALGVSTQTHRLRQRRL